MTNMFAKIFGQIFDSSIASDYMVRHVFMDLLVLADRDGVVDMTLDAIARRTNVPEEIVAHAIKTLMEPDDNSRSPEADGARIVLLDSHRNWGWQIVNYEHYKHIRDDEARRAYFRDKKREYRAEQRSNPPVDSPSPSDLSTPVLDSPTLSTPVTKCTAVSTEGEGEGEGELNASPAEERGRGASAKSSPKTPAMSGPFDGLVLPEMPAPPGDPSKEPKPPKPPTKSDLVNTRHAEFKAAIGDYWKAKNPGVEMPWGPAEGRNLAIWMRESPNTTLEQFTAYLRHRFRSDVNHAERPSDWIRNVTSYASGPLDRFNKPAATGKPMERGGYANGPPSAEAEAYERKVKAIMAERKAHS